MIQRCWNKPISLRINEWKEKHALKFRLQSAFSSALIHTYLQLGFMVKIPKTMEAWSKRLFELLTVNFFEVEEFRKTSNVMQNSCYTCSNIPVLVAILVILEDKGVISCGDSLLANVKKHFNAKGMHKRTKTWIDKSSWPEADVEKKHSWAGTIQTDFIVMGAPQPNNKMQLHEMINLLVHGNDKNINGELLPKAQFLRPLVCEALKDLKIGRLRRMIMEGPVKDVPAAGLVDRLADDERTVKMTNPFTSKKELETIMVKNVDDELDHEAMVERMQHLRRDFLAKALNLSLHLKILDSGSDLQDDHEPNEASKDKKKQDFGRLKFLMRPKPPKKPKKDKKAKATDKAEGDDDDDDDEEEEVEVDKGAAANAASNTNKSVVPTLFQRLWQFETDMTMACTNKCQNVDYTAKPRDIWENLKKITISEWDQDMVQDPDPEDQTSLKRTRSRGTPPAWCPDNWSLDPHEDGSGSEASWNSTEEIAKNTTPKRKGKAKTDLTASPEHEHTSSEEDEDDRPLSQLSKKEAGAALKVRRAAALKITAAKKATEKETVRAKAGRKRKAEEKASAKKKKAKDSAKPKTGNDQAATKRKPEEEADAKKKNAKGSATPVDDAVRLLRSSSSSPAKQTKIAKNLASLNLGGRRHSEH